MQLLLMLTISLDLVFLTYRPTKYHTVHLFPYAILIQLPCFLLSSALSVASIPFIDRSTIVFCDIAEAYPKATAKLWNFSTILVGVGVLAIYALVMFEMWLRDLKNVRKSEGVCKLDPSMRYQRKMIRTVSVMTTAFLCTG
ncbi:hypothetical protein Q1695_004644 [Nippostrongylus brasiliensis]|nr:hypothetical protein Q1695_004644 [Nippostrongylus brasiliensis]